jgi:hypothetical protein
MIKQGIITVLTILFWCNLKFNSQTIQCSFPSLEGTLVKFGTFEGLNKLYLTTSIGVVFCFGGV